MITAHVALAGDAVSSRLSVLVSSSSPVVTVCVQATLARPTGGSPGAAAVMSGPAPAELEKHLQRHGGCGVVLLHDPGLKHVNSRIVRLAPLILIASDGELSGPEVMRALRTGVKGFISIASDLDSLHRACLQIADGKGYFSPALVTVLAEHLSGASLDGQVRYGLTAREGQVLRLLAEGCSSMVIARRLAITPRTTKHHLSNIYRRLGVNSSVEALVRAYREGLVG